jgi:hypothetical protein
MSQMSGMPICFLISVSAPAFRHRHTDEFAPGFFEGVNLLHRRRHVERVGGGHALHADRLVPADADSADRHRAGLVPRLAGHLLGGFEHTNVEAGHIWASREFGW